MVKVILVNGKMENSMVKVYVKEEKEKKDMGYGMKVKKLNGLMNQPIE